MNFVEHPPYFEQMQAISSISSTLTHANVHKLLLQLGLQLVSFKLLQTSGRVNLIFGVIAQSDVPSNIELILKVSNPHPYWREFRTKNEVYVMKYLLKHSSIPIPKVYDYSTNAKTSLLSCEYILMEKIDGNTLESVIGNMPDQILFNIIMTLIDYVKELRQIKLPETNKIGSFCNEEMFLGGSIEDGPTLGPFNSLKEYIIEHLRWAVQRIKTDDELFRMGKHLILPLEKVIDSAQTDSNLSNSAVKLRMTHTDLNSSNILVDENSGKILGIIDWESCSMTFKNEDVEFYSYWFDDNRRKQRFESLIQQEKNYIDLVKEKFTMHEVNLYLDVMYSAMYATFYSCTWFEHEQTVYQHIEHFLQELDKAITIINKDIIDKNT